eukprot:7591531-Pyramimonas_sp.AAC.1
MREGAQGGADVAARRGELRPVVGSEVLAPRGRAREGGDLGPRCAGGPRGSRIRRRRHALAARREVLGCGPHGVRESGDDDLLRRRVRGARSSGRSG